jgi:hypothetical protein
MPNDALRASAMTSPQPLDRLYRIAGFADAIEMFAFDTSPDWRVKALGAARTLAEAIRTEAEQAIEALESEETQARTVETSTSSNI